MKNFKNLKEFLKSKIVKTSIACLLLTSVVGSMIPIHSYANTEDGYYEWTDFVSAGSIEGYNEIVDDYNKLDKMFNALGVRRSKNCRLYFNHN